MITASDKIYTEALVLLTGAQRNRLNGSDFDALRSGGWAILLYVAPDYDAATHKLGAMQNNGDTTCSEVVTALTQQEIDAAVVTARETMSLSRYQFRAGINNVSVQKRADLEAYILTLTQTEQDWWMHGDYYPRTHINITNMMATLGFSDTQLDTFFRSGALF